VGAGVGVIAVVVGVAGGAVVAAEVGVLWGVAENVTVGEVLGTGSVGRGVSLVLVQPLIAAMKLIIASCRACPIGRSLRIGHCHGRQKRDSSR
jgi:hypothetical protein